MAATGDGGLTRGAEVTFSSFECLRLERQGPVGWLINNCPDVLNATTALMGEELARAWTELDRDTAVKVIVHTGVGRAFQTGCDFSEIAADDAVVDFRSTSWQPQVWKPVIAAVNGLCSGEGLHSVADADIVIAASDAEFFDPHVSAGQVSAIALIGLLKKMPAEAVMRMALVGRYERLPAKRALQLGMISQVVDPPDGLRDEAQALAEKVAANSPAAMRATKRALWGAFELGLTDACRAGSAELVSLWGHADQEEGPRAFAERRQPKWQD